MQENLPEWFDAAIEFARGLQANTKGSPRATKSVYAILLRDNEKDRWGLYVGITGLTPEQRFRNHMAGYKASRKKWVQRYGFTLAPSIFSHLNPCEFEEAQGLEKLLITRLPEVGVPWVQGN